MISLLLYESKILAFYLLRIATSNIFLIDSRTKIIQFSLEIKRIKSDGK